MRRIGILADDLTGALDAAAPFASERTPVAVCWGDSLPAADGDFAFDSETRSLSPERAGRKVTTLVQGLRGSAIAFKKINSLMRGNTVPELVACCASAPFASVVIAPAFPEQNRITRGGRQLAPGGDDGQPIAIDLAGGLTGEGVAIRVIGREEDLPAGGVAVFDAETTDDLARVVALSPSLAKPILWCGTAGLARALSAGASSGLAHDGGPRLLVIGSRHPVSLAQTARLRRDWGKRIVTVAAPEEAESAVAAIDAALRAGESRALAFALPQLDPDDAEAFFRRIFAMLSDATPPETAVVVGGDTLFRLCGEMGAGRLDAVGEWMPGIAVSRFADGRWEGTTVISKSGAFGGDDTLSRLFGEPEGRVR